MNKKIKLTTVLFILAVITVVLGFKRLETDSGFNKVTTNDVYNFIAVNQVLMYQANNGDGSHDPATDGNGFYWPGGRQATKSAIFEDGFLFGGKVGGDVRVGGSTYRSGLQAGKVLENGDADDPSLEKYRVFKIRKGWENLTTADGFTQAELDAYQRDYEEWPVEDGAPVDSAGNPAFVGDEVLWFVANDFDASRTTFLYGKPPLGMEVQATIFAFNKTGTLGDIVFKKYTIINKGTNTVDDMVLAYWSDTDLGGANDDFTGCDTNLVLGYTYNADSEDDVYGSPVPAVGYDFFQGPIVPSPGDSAKFLTGYRQGFRNLGLTSFSLYINSSATYSDPDLGAAVGSTEMYNYMTSKVGNGNDFIDPNTGRAVSVTVAGDPVAGTGWFEGRGWPGGPVKGDRRHVMSSGPFRMVPGDTQEVVVGLVIAVGKDNINSISKLKKASLIAQNAYDFDFLIPDSPPTPQVKAVPLDRQIRLYWEDNAESYNSLTYKFEGYQVWQYSDETGSDPVLLATYDVPFNDVKNIFGDVDFDGLDVTAPIIQATDVDPLQRTYLIEEDKYSNSTLINNKDYYFAVSAYGYSPQRVPESLDSPRQILTVRPQTPKIDVTYGYDPDEIVVAEKTSGFADGFVGLRIIDPLALNGHTYEFSFEGEPDALLLNIVDKTDNDTMVSKSSVFPSVSDTAKIIDGFMIIAQNIGLDSLGGSIDNNAIKEVTEIRSGNTDLATPLNVLDGNLNTSGRYYITAENFTGAGGSKADMNWQNAAGRDAYEIRFTTEADGSEYYLTGYASGFVTTAPLKSDVKAANKVPFQVWSLGEDLASADDDQRLIIKVLDNNSFDSEMTIPDNVWTKFPASSERAGQWERFFAYYPVDSLYPADGVLPEESGLSNRPRGLHKIGHIIINGDVPEAGTVVRIDTWKPLTSNDTYSVTATTANVNDLANAKRNLDEISIFPNPYFGANKYERDRYQRFVTISNLPTKATVRIFTLAGIFVDRLDKDDATQYLRWDMKNIDNLPVASGMYILHVDMPGIGTKIFKLAVIQEQQVLDRI